MSLFSDINFDEGSDNPFGLTKGTHAVTVSEAKVSRSEAGNLGLWLTFTGEGKKSIRKWVTLPEQSQSEEVRIRNTSFLRMILKSLGIPREVWDTLEPNHFIGIECVVNVVPQPNSEYFQVKKIMAKGTVTDAQDTAADKDNWTVPKESNPDTSAVFSGKGGF